MEFEHSSEGETMEISLAPEAIQEEMREKERRVREFLERSGYRAVLFKRQANFSWMTCGGLNTVGITTDLGATSLLILPDRKFLISNNIEAPRMMEEEGIIQKGFEVEVFDWYEDREAEMVKKIVGARELQVTPPSLKPPSSQRSWRGFAIL